MNQQTDLLGIGLTGTSLTDLERRIITESTPYAVVLFGRNIASVAQLRDLVAEVKSIGSRPPLFMIDMEGGRVDRLRNLVPGLPSAEAFLEGAQPEEMSRWLGRIIGLSLHFFDIECDLAPVVDIRGDHASKGLERRTFGNNAADVVRLASEFVRGLHSAGTAACLKHFPGIGRGTADSHYGATVIDVSREELLARELVPFRDLGNESAAIMVGHGTYPQIEEPEVPATLSRKITTDLLRGPAEFKGLAMTDDMEMHAVADLGPYETITQRAIMAGNDIVLYCSHIERVPDLQRFIAERARTESEFKARCEQASQRAEAFRGHCASLRAAAPPVLASFDDLTAELIRFLDAFHETRPVREIFVPDAERRRNNRTPGKGHTGREEWT